MTPALRARSGDRPPAPEAIEPAAPPPAPLWVTLSTLAIAYLAAALLSLLLSRTANSVASVWYANAVAIAMLHGQPRARWPVLVVTLALLNPLANVIWGDDWRNAMAFAPANLAEVVLGALLLRRHGPPAGENLSQGGLMRLVVLGGVLPQVVGATLGTLTITVPHDGTFTGIWLPWFSSSVIGTLSVMPLAYLMVQGGRAALRATVFDLRTLALVPMSVGVTLASLIYLPFPFVSITLPLLLAAGLVPLRSVALLTAISSLTIAYALGRGLFVPPPQASDWAVSYLYLAFAFTLVPGQVLAAAISELRLSRERLARSSEALEKSNHSLEQFVRIAAHDLREPLNTISAFGQLLEQRCGAVLDEQGRQFLRHMQQGSTRIRTVLDDVLQFVRLQHEQLPAFERVELQAICDEALQALAQRMSATGAQVDARLDGAVLGHPVLLSLVLQNLLQNALKFMPADRAPKIEVTSQRDGADWLIQVADNGIGIAAEDMARLFQPFQRLHPRRKYEGTGLGLALVQQIVQAHGGQISVQSRLGEGSCFSLRLPAQP
ncbi:ATP-binding protein [Ideonella sp. DXS29W]|uniref:histidine kinase n=1 Tax=Ideonella lacteola TaxID=2984193 RepID=A0ABU9BSD5_9BURK